MTHLSNNGILEMIESATYRECEELAESHDDLTADELYGFVLGDNEKPECFAAFKESILNAQLEHDLYRAGY